MYTILEDCSPYYVKFTYDNLHNDLELIRSFVPNTAELKKEFTHYQLSVDDGVQILNSLPMSNTLNLRKERVSFFITKPGYYYRAHKDGYNTRMSINYMISVLDKECDTSWYSDDVAEGYDIDTMKGFSRELKDFDKDLYDPLKRLTFKQDELVLFNTDIYHDFDNSKSKNERIVLTLRSYEYGTLYFDDAKQKLFG